MGIGETRAILIDESAPDAIHAARVCWHEPWRAGAVAMARLVSRHPGSRRGIMRLPDDSLIEVAAIPPGLTGGASVPVRVTRAALAEKGRYKLAQGRAVPGATPHPAPDLADSLRETGVPVVIAGPLDRRFDTAGWDELIETAQTGEIDFAGGRLVISPTPAMTLVDVDGPPPLPALAHAAALALPGALARLDIAGSVGIDFPSLEARADRVAVDAALGEALEAAGWQGERTAMNGFGFVQLVSRLERPSLLARHAFAPARAAAFALLRRAGRVAEPGALLLVAHPLVLSAIDPAQEAELARRTGRPIRREPRPGLALHGGFAQAVDA